MSVEDVNNDQQGCYEPQANSFQDSIKKVAKLINNVHGRMEDASKVSGRVHPSDSISVVSHRKSKKSSFYASSTSSAHVKTEMEKAVLTAKVAGLMQKHILEEHKAKRKAEKEALDILGALTQGFLGPGTVGGGLLRHGTKNNRAKCE